MINTVNKQKFHDNFLDIDLDLTPQEIVDYGIYLIEDRLEPEAKLEPEEYHEELKYYETTLKSLKDSNVDLKERVNKAIEVMEIANIYLY